MSCFLTSAVRFIEHPSAKKCWTLESKVTSPEVLGRRWLLEGYHLCTKWYLYLGVTPNRINQPELIDLGWTLYPYTIMSFSSAELTCWRNLPILKHLMCKKTNSSAKLYITYKVPTNICRNWVFSYPLMYIYIYILSLGFSHHPPGWPNFAPLVWRNLVISKARRYHLASCATTRGCCLSKSPTRCD